MADGVPMFDDIPSFDDLPDAPEQTAQASAVPRFDDIPAFDDLPDGQPEAEGAFMSGVREAAHGVIPAAAGFVGAGVGVAAGALTSPVTGPVGPIVGGVGGMVAASMGAEALQNTALKAVGFDDDAQRAANREANPKSSFVGGLAPAVAGMSPVGVGEGLAKQALVRGTGAAMMGGFEAGQEYLNEGHVDPTKTAIAAATGAVFPAANRVGAKLMGAGERMVPGRPNTPANPAADQAHADVADPTVETSVANSALAEPAPTSDGNTTGNPQSAPQRSARLYGKGKAPAEPGQDILTQGDMAPDIALAIRDPNSPPGPADQPVPASPNAAKPRLSLKRAPAPVEEPPVAPGLLEAKAAHELPAEPVVDAGFPKPGEPVAMGENEATPMPPGTPERAAKAIARSKSQLPKNMVEAEQQRLSGEKPMPELKGEAPINDSVTEAQKAAGNYPKARSHDFGKPQAVETHAGDMRRGKSQTGEDWEVKLPYDYGYFNKTRGADKDHIDFARPVKGSAEAGDKHFIIDQKNAETGKFDEHKAFTYYKDEAAARKHYEEGFSDNKGPDRLGAITEVSRGDMVKFLAKHTTKAAKTPYGDMPAEPKQRAVVKDLVEKLKAAGKTDEVAALESMPAEQLAKAVEGKRLRKYGTPTGDSAGYAVEGLTNSEGKPVTANTKAKAAERSASHKAVTEWYAKSAPKKDPTTETNGELLGRIRGAKLEGWEPTFKPKEWLLARDAKRTLSKPTPGNIKKFRDAERQLRGGDEDVNNYRSGNRIEADIANSRRSGDEEIARAEEAQTDVRNTVEDDLIASIDAKKTAKFDVPHEEAEAMVEPVPVRSRKDLTKKAARKEVNVNDSELAKIDVKAIDRKVNDAAAKRRQEALELAGKKSKAPTAESEGAAGEARTIKVSDKEELARIIEAANLAAKRGNRVEALPAEPEVKSSGPKDLFEKFASDERGSMDVNKIIAAAKTMLADLKKKTEHKSYIAKDSAGAFDDYIRSLGEDLHRIKKQDENHFIGLMQDASSWPKALNNEKTLREIYHARDADSAHVDLPGKLTGKTNIESLPAPIKALYDTHMKPVLDANDATIKAIRAIDENRVGPDVENHISRISKGEDPDFNMLKSQDDPTAPQYSGMSVNAAAAKTRKFYALERVSDGKRMVISPEDGGGKFSLWNKYKKSVVNDPDFAFEDGKAYKAGANDYIMRQATTKEIEANARGSDDMPMKYYDNAGWSAAVANTQLTSMARHLQELHRISETKEFGQFSTRNRAKAEERGWAESTLPNFKGTYMHPDLKAVFDDYAGHPQTGYRRFNSAITKLLFWLPTAHINNVGAHWFVGRGWDNITPKGVVELVKTFPKAAMSVINQDAYQMKMRNEGAGLIYGGVLTREPVKKLAKAFQMDIERNPSEWGPIADKLGVPAKELGKEVYDVSSKVMWSVNDMFLTQRVMELERKGMSMKQAIIEAERDIPNYRLPIKIMGSRFIAETVGDPAKLAFGRYHYGMWNSYANIVKDAVGPDKTAGDRLEAVGKMMAFGMLTFAIYPILDKAASLVTGNPEAKAQRRGPTSVPHHVMSALEGKTDIMQAARGTFTIPPLISTALETLQNKDFRGKQIVEPGDLRAAARGSGAAIARVGVQEGEHALRGLVSPYSTYANANKKDISLPGAIRDNALDIKNPSAKAIKYERMSPITSERGSRSRFRQGGAGPLENLTNKITGYR